MVNFPVQPLRKFDTHRVIIQIRETRCPPKSPRHHDPWFSVAGEPYHRASLPLELLKFEDDRIRTPGLHSGWAESKQWPQRLLDPDLSKSLMGSQHKEYGNNPEGLRCMEEECRSDWDEPLRNEYPGFDTEDLNKGITTVNYQDNKDESRSGRLWRLFQAVEIALILEERSTEEDLLRRYIPDFAAVRQSFYERGHEIAAGRQVWALLSDGFLAKALHVSEEALVKYVQSLLETLTQRIENGPQRPYKDKSIKELIDVLDEL